MTRLPRLDTQRLDLAGFEAWLRSQLTGTAFAAVVVIILQMVRALFEQNTQLRSRILGRRVKPPSERLSVVERQVAFLFAVPVNDVTPDAAAAPTPAQEQSGQKKRRRSPRARKPLPKHIATIEVANDVPADQRQCEDCGVAMKTVGYRAGGTTFELIPAKVEAHVRRDETIACPKCDAIRTANAPPALLDGGLLGSTLVTEALASKVLDAMPIERQTRNYQRQGIPVSASTLGRSIGAALDLLVPVAKRVINRVKHSTHVQFDSSGLRVLDTKAPMGTHRDTLWVLVGDGKWVSFAALESGDANAIEELMRGADADTWQCDGTSTTNFVERKWMRCRPGCHSHARRRLVEALRRGDFRALELLRLYGKLFAVEKLATREGVDAAERQRRREVHSVPILEQMRVWVVEKDAGVEPRSALGEALTYLKRQWMRLFLFVLCGEVEITNNRSERELRPWVLGQHAWLFVGDQKNAERWAAGFTLAHTALAHGVNPRAYLHAVIKRLIAGHPHTRLDELLPDAMLRAEPAIADPLRITADAQVSASDPRAA